MAVSTAASNAPGDAGPQGRFITPPPSLPRGKSEQKSRDQYTSRFLTSIIHRRGLPWELSWYRIRPQCKRPWFDSWVGKIWKWQPTPVFLPGQSHGRRSVGVYSSWGHTESDKTERLHFHFHSHKETEASRRSVTWPRSRSWGPAWSRTGFQNPPNLMITERQGTHS